MGPDDLLQNFSEQAVVILERDKDCEANHVKMMHTIAKQCLKCIALIWMRLVHFNKILRVILWFFTVRGTQEKDF